jgi:hypothetical protein
VEQRNQIWRLVVVIGAFTLSSCTLPDPVRFEFAGSDEAGLSPFVMEIPRAYIKDIQGRRPDRFRFIELETGFPDFAPRPALPSTRAEQGTKEYEVWKQAWATGLYVELYRGPAAQPAAYLRWWDLNRRMYGDEFATDFGLRAITKRVCGYRAQDVTQEHYRCDTRVEYYLTKNSFGGQKIKFICTPIERNPIGGCEATAAFRDRYVKYIFRRTELERWREIHSGLTAFLESLVIESSQAYQEMAIVTPAATASG